MGARESLLRSAPFANEIEDFKPIIRAGGSSFRRARQRYRLSARRAVEAPHVMMMLVPEAWAHDPEMTPEKRGFYEYHGC